MLIDKYGQSVRWWGDTKMIGRIHVHERRHIKIFFAGMANGSVSVLVNLYEVTVALTKGIADFVYYCFQRTIRVIAVIDTERIERVSEQTRIAQEFYRAAS